MQAVHPHAHRRFTRNHHRDPERPAEIAPAAADLRFIRSTLERTTSFTAVSGVGTMLVGSTALLATLIASRQPSVEAWLLVWACEFVVAFAIAGFAMARKAGGLAAMLHSPAARRCACCLLPAALSGLVLTALVLRMGWIGLHSSTVPGWLPGIWILMYGVAVFTGGSFSLPLLRVMGAAFAAFGALACLTALSAAFATAVAFACMHILFGLLIAREERR